MASRKGSPNKISMTALKDMERLGINPIEMLKAVYDRAVDAYDKCRGLNDKSDAGAAYLSVAGQAAMNLAKFKHPTLSAVAIKDLGTEADERKPLTTEEAIKVIQSDPFAPANLKDIQTANVIEAINSTIQTPMLPGGKND